MNFVPKLTLWRLNPESELSIKLNPEVHLTSQRRPTHNINQLIQFLHKRFNEILMSTPKC